jgi:histidine ammonia-lyase
VSLAVDVLAIALTQLGNISDRRIHRLGSPTLSDLPPFLTGQAGVQSGFLTVQIVASSLASENKSLAHPASVDSIPTSGNEDFVSMSMGAAVKARQIVENTRHILAIELLCACQGIDFRAPLKTGALAAKAVEAVRAVAPTLEQDRVMTPDIEAVSRLISGGTFQKLLAS